MELTKKEFGLAAIIALMGFAFTSRPFLLWLNDLTPLEGLVVYYALLYTVAFILSKLGLVVFGEKVENPLQVFGVILVTFAFFIVVDWESAYISYAVNGPSNVPNIYLQAEDGAIFWIWQQILPTATMQTLRLLTYVLTPFLLAVTGLILISEEIELNWI
jgi:hypothetical protein